MKVFFCAGEPSSDQHGANAIRALRRIVPEARCEGLGGVRMQQAGMDLHFDLAQSSIMGFVEVVKSLTMIRRLYRDTVRYFERERPDVAVLIDYPGFNLRLAARAHALGIRVLYYISPQIWAWKRGRIKAIRRDVDKMLVILPFEQAIYDEAGVPCEYVGHPLLDQIERFEPSGQFAGDTVIGILPGSRAQEIQRILPVMLEVAAGIRERYPKARFVAPCVNDERAAQIRSIAGEFPLETAPGAMHDVLSAARFCLVASGTATVETCLFGVPMVVLYRAAPISIWLARKLVGRRLKAIAMVNILADRTIVPEFLQNDATCANILPQALDLIDDTNRRREMIRDLAAVRSMLKAGASEAVARNIAALAAAPPGGTP